MQTQAEASDARAKNASRLVIAVLVASWLGWWAHREFAEPDTCGWQPDPDARPVECVLPYYIWLNLTFPNQRYIDEFSLTVDDIQLFESCMASYPTPYGTVLEWASAAEDAGAEVTERVLDACYEWVYLTFEAPAYEVP